MQIASKPEYFMYDVIM